MKSHYKILTTLFFLILLTICSPIYAQDQAKKAEAEKLANEAGAAFKEERYDEAIDKSNKLLEFYPGSTDIYLIRAMAFQKKGEAQKAIEDWTTVINGNSSPETKLTAYKMRAILLHQTKKYSDAIKDFDFILSKDSGDYRAFVYRGWCNFFLDNHQAAISDFDAGLKINPKQDNIRRFRAQSHLKLGNYEKAIEDINEELKINNKPVSEVYRVRAEAYRKLGKNDLAEADEKKFAEENGEVKKTAEPVSEETLEEKLGELLQKAGAQFDKGEWTSVIQTYDEIFKLFDPNDKLLYGIYFSRGRAYFEKGDLDLAFKDYNEAIKRKPEFAGSYVFRGEVHLKRKDYENAIKDFTEGIKRDNKDILGYRRRAEAHYLIKNYKNAIDDASEAIKINPKYSSSWYYRAISNFDNGEFQSAVNDFTEYLKLEPDDSEIYLERAKAYRKLNKIKEAEADEARAKQMNVKQN